jgi:Ser/Thr protein kinase RdoA (MazF antagonist)
MEKRIKDRYSQAIHDDLLARFGVDITSVKELDGFESFIYAYTQNGRGYILRVGHSLRRSVELIHGEVDWLNHLAAGGAGVARAVRSQEGRLVEQAPDGQGEVFLATAFVEAVGHHPGWKEFTPELLESYGAMLGRMHALSVGYQPADPSWRRLHWDDPVMLEVEQQLPPSEALALERFQELMGHLGTLPRHDPAVYGLIHQDAHGGNLLVDEQGRITLFDFDDCAYSWYANDIAIVLFYAVMWQEDKPAATQWFMHHFLRGYRKEYALDSAWLAEIPHFLKLREIDLYAVIHRSFDLQNLDDPWVEGYMKGRKERIEASLPYIDFDFNVFTT